MNRRARAAATARPVADIAEATPLRFGDDPYVWASWLYYQEGMTQSDIADAMGVSRATVIAYLAEARARGIVNVSLEPERLASLTVAQTLKRHFGLQDCFVLPDRADDRALTERLGAAGALALRKLARSGDTLAVTGGRSVMAVGAQLPNLALQDVTVVQATGVAFARSPFAPDLCAATIAAAMSANCVHITAPAFASSAQARDVFMREPLVVEQFAALARANKALFGVASLRPNSTFYSSGLVDAPDLQRHVPSDAVGVVATRFIDAYGARIEGVLDDRVIGVSLQDLRRIETRIAVAGGFDKVPAILAAIRGGYVSVLVTNAGTALGVLRADGVSELDGERAPAPQPKSAAPAPRTFAKKFINDPDHVVEEMLDGAVRAHRDYLKPVGASRRAVISHAAPRVGKVGLVIGGGSGHEPCFLGYVGPGVADAATIGNIFSTPPPDPIFQCAKAVSGGAGVLFVFGNYVGDVMNFEMAAEITQEHGIETRSVTTTDDVASSPRENRDARRGVAGNVFVFKIAGAACDLGWPLEACEAVTRKANARTFTVGVALEPCALPQTRRYNFEIGADEMEFGVGIHGEPGVLREPFRSADQTVDRMLDVVFADMKLNAGDEVAVLVNSLGGTPLMELYVLYRRVEQRLVAKGVGVDMRLVGHYCTSIDMVGASISLIHLDTELRQLLHHPCRTPSLQIG